MTDLSEKADFGIEGLDDITVGGLARGRLFLLEGSPGTGKTTIATQFLMAGAAAGERALYITLSETEDELRAGATSHGWSLEGVDIFELVPPESLLDEDQQQSLLYSSDLELGETTKRIFEAFEKVKPERVVLDSLSEIRLLAQSSLRYRRQILALKHYFARSGATVLMLDDLSSEANDRTMHSVAHGVIRLEELSPEYGAGAPAAARHQISRPAISRRLSRLRHRHRRRAGVPEASLGRASQAVQARGAANPVLGAQRLAWRRRRARLQRPHPRAGRHREVAARPDLRRRSHSTAANRPRCSCSTRSWACCSSAPRASASICRRWSKADRLVIEQIDAAELTPGELSARVRHCVEEQHARTVVIDSLNGYQAAMPEEQALILHMHELLQYLNRQGASTFLTVAQHGLVGDMKAPVDVTYLADTVILLRYFEALGRVRRAISVIKKRTERARGHDPRISDRRSRHHARRSADGLPGRPSRRARAGRNNAEICLKSPPSEQQRLRTRA